MPVRFQRAAAGIQAPVPRPPSPAGLRQSVPKEAAPVLPKSKRGGQAPLGLARLDNRRARPGGAVNGGALVRRSS